MSTSLQSLTFDHISQHFSPSINSDPVMQEIPAVKYVKDFDSFFNLNDTYMGKLSQRADKCGYTDFLNKYLVYPPTGKLPTPVSRKKRECSLWVDIKKAAQKFNPCFNMYDISTTCPLLWDVLGFPGSFEYLPPDAQIYFTRSDVQKAINAPIGPWQECGDVALEKDSSLPSGLTILPSVIERSKRTIIAHGNLDFILLKEGSLLTIQNMTWNGAQGFQRPPKADFYVPYHREKALGSLAGSGNLGVTHTERGLTWVEVFLSGHMIPQYQPSAAYRQLEFLLGRIRSLDEISGFTTQADVPQGVGVKKQSRTQGNETRPGGSGSGGVRLGELFGR
jgi:carboxypeptidase D